MSNEGMILFFTTVLLFVILLSAASIGVVQLTGIQIINFASGKTTNERLGFKATQGNMSSTDEGDDPNGEMAPVGSTLSSDHRRSSMGPRSKGCLGNTLDMLFRNAYTPEYTNTIHRYSAGRPE